MKKFLLLLLLSHFFQACSNIEFAFNKSESKNPLFEKTNVIITGSVISVVSNIVLSKFGTTQNGAFDLIIDISEKKIRTAIKTNQVSTKIDYEILFNYSLKNISKKCTILTKKQYSRFSFVPKSEGYNFGSDKFLENLYFRNIEDNINQFLNNLEDTIEDKKCINEN